MNTPPIILVQYPNKLYFSFIKENFDEDEVTFKYFNENEEFKKGLLNKNPDAISIDKNICNSAWFERIIRDRMLKKETHVIIPVNMAKPDYMIDFLNISTIDINDIKSTLYCFNKIVWNLSTDFCSKKSFHFFKQLHSTNFTLANEMIDALKESITEKELTYLSISGSWNRDQLIIYYHSIANDFAAIKFDFICEYFKEVNQKLMDNKFSHEESDLLNQKLMRCYQKVLCLMNEL
jgi:hypothetical protein